MSSNFKKDPLVSLMSLSEVAKNLEQPPFLPGNPLPQASNLQAFPRETLAHILQYTAEKRAVRLVCKRFNEVVNSEWKRMHKITLGKMYIERIGDSSYLIKITRLLTDTENLFEIEIDCHDIHIFGPSGCFGMFGDVYKRTRLCKITIFETDKKQVLATVLKPIMKAASFAEVEMDDISAETIIQLKDIFNYTKSSTVQLKYRRRPTQEKEYTDDQRPTGTHLLELIEASRCSIISTSGLWLDLDFWKDKRLTAVSEILDGHGGRTEVQIAELELLERSSGKFQYNWNSELTVGGVQAMIQAWQKGQKEIARVVLRLSRDEQYEDICAFLAVPDGCSRNFYRDTDLEKRQPLRVTISAFYHEFDMGYVSFEC